jgi:hypothetical protein
MRISVINKDLLDNTFLFNFYLGLNCLFSSPDSLELENLAKRAICSDATHR